MVPGLAVLLEIATGIGTGSNQEVVESILLQTGETVPNVEILKEALIGEDRGRDSGLWLRDRSPSRHSSGTGPLLTPSAIGAPLHTSQSHLKSSERPAPKMPYDRSRRQSGTLSGSGPSRDIKREHERADYFNMQTELHLRDSTAARASSPAAAPQVPAFGLPLELLTPAPAPASTPQQTVEKIASAPDVTATVPNSQQVIFQPPKGPRADRDVPQTQTIPRGPKTQPVEQSFKTEHVPSSKSRPIPATSDDEAVDSVSPSVQHNSVRDDPVPDNRVLHSGVPLWPKAECTNWT